MNPVLRAHLQIHFCVLLWGFTAILGRVITLPAAELVWWRMLLVAASLLLLPRVWRALSAMPWREIARFAGIGVLVALHWLTFYGAIKLANASVAVSCMALAPVFTALVAPLLSRHRPDPRELLLGVAAVPAVALVVGGTPQAMQLGLVSGVVSAALAATFNALNKQHASERSALAVTCIELGAGTLVLTMLIPLLGASFALPGLADAGWLLVLAWGCTLLPFALSLVALRRLSAFAAQLAINLEPVYAIALAALLFGEQRELGIAFYLGVALLLAAVFAQPLLERRRPGSRAEPGLAAESMALGEAPSRLARDRES